MPDEYTLLQRLQRHDETALRKAIELYTPYLNTVIYRAVGAAISREDMEEIVADVFVSLWRNSGRIDFQKGTLRSYIAAAARKLAFKRLNSLHTTVPLEELAAAEEPTAAAGQVEEQFLWDCVKELGEQDFELFVRYYKYRETLKQISSATGLKLSTVKTRLSRGKKKLKQILEHAEGTL